MSAYTSSSMNKKVANLEPVTEEKLREVLTAYPTKKDVEFIVDSKIDGLETRIDEKARSYRDEILTRLDGVMGELAQIREDRVFEEHDVKVLKEKADDNGKRIEKLEATQASS